MNERRKSTAPPVPEASPSDSLLQIVQTALDDAKAVDVAVIDVHDQTTITDYMVVASGNSTRHVKTLAETVALRSKEAGIDVLGMEGGGDAEWVLVDLADVVVHLMLPRARAFYALEKLWSMEEAMTAEQR